MTVKKILLRDSGRNVEQFVDDVTGMVYRRIASGFGWPFAGRPGFVVFLGEDFTPDYTLPRSPRHFRVLNEVESEDLEYLHRTCLRLQDEFCLDSISGDNQSPLYDIWRSLEERDDSVSLSQPGNWDKITLDMISQLIIKHTRTQKTLHFGAGSRLPGYLSELTAERIQKNDIEAAPSIVSLGLPLIELDLTEPSKPFVRNRAYESWRTA